ncbi:MAG TPA: hypothetical protein DIW45_04660 [Erythrobacter sp.]|nr:hypothetical protein [Erythrobacter sp.]
MDDLREVIAKARVKARKRIVFQAPHGCNYDVADDIFAQAWDAALAAIKAAKGEQASAAAARPPYSIRPLRQV